MNMMNRISNEILIILTILIRCSLTLPSALENATTLNGLDTMFISNDLQCLAQMPYTDLMKIRKAIRMMHVVSDYDAHQTWNLTTSKIDNQNHNQSDSLLRELPADETRHVFQYISRFKTSTTKSPLAEPFMMTNQMHNAWRNNQLT